jgi:hypothetical protein
MGRISLVGDGEKSAHIRGDLFPRSRRVRDRVSPDPMSLRLVEFAPPLSAEVLHPRSGGLLKVMPPKGQRFFTVVMRFAAGGSPIGLSGLRRSAALWLGFSLMDVLPRLADHDRAQRMRRHLLWSGFSWAWLCGACFGCQVRRILRLKCRYRKSTSAAISRWGSTMGPWDEASRNSRTQDGARASVTRNKASSTSTSVLLICAREGQVCSTRRSRYSHRFQRRSCSANQIGGLAGQMRRATLIKGSR